MAIKTPKWLPNGAYPTHMGWVSAKGEVLKKQKISSADLIEWHQATTQEVSPIQMLTEAPSKQSELSEEVISHYYHRDDTVVADVVVSAAAEEDDLDAF